MKLTYTLGVSWAVALVAACSDDKPDGTQLAESIAKGLIAACPAGDNPADEAARNDCAGKLTDFSILRATMREPFIWGGQKEGNGYRLDKSTNKFNARVWRRMYLSTFMFGEDYSIEQIADYTILHTPITFRGEMSIGAYPYPFWHADGKWNAYNFAVQIHWIIQNGEVIGALRSTEQDTTRAKTPHAWDGQWMWEQGGQDQPYVSLYEYLFSKDNPYVAEVDQTYRALESGMRKNNCQVCHAPDNQGASQQLEFFVYPNQALAGRHDIVKQLERNEMPPKDNTLGFPVGLADAERDQLMTLAKDFQLAGDKALEYDGDNKIQYVFPDAQP